MAQPYKRKQCVAIAQDVIKQIKARKYIAQTGAYFTPPKDNKFVAGDLQKQLMSAPPCKVCALGSALLSTVRLHNQFELDIEKGWDNRPTGGVYLDSDKMHDRLKEFFTQEEIAMIEAIFEGDDDFLEGAYLYHGANIEARDSNGETPLRRAVNCSQPPVASILLKLGADPKSQCNRGRTPQGAARTDKMRSLFSAP